MYPNQQSNILCDMNIIHYRDVPEISNSTADTSDAIVCCGHGTSSKITSIAFQPEGSLLATACDASNMLLFDTKAFRSGGVVAPLATVHLNGM